jgi:hypothetical protein
MSPPESSITRPVRNMTVRTPASRAGRVSFLPDLYDVGEEARSLRRGFGELGVARVVVIVLARRTDEDLRLRPGHRLGDEAGFRPAGTA